jgi:hypothetical protein
VPEGSIFSVSDGCSLTNRSLGLPTERTGPTPALTSAEPFRTTLVDEFMIDHRALAEGIKRLIEALRTGRTEDARFEAVRIDRVSGCHIAFEEADLYPAIGAEPSMYEEHRAGRAMLQTVLDADETFTGADRLDLISQADDMLDHMEDCGVLLHRVRTLAPLVQSELEDRLLAWRETAPKWTELSVAHHA